MKKSLILVFSCSLAGISAFASGQTNNNTTPANPQNPVIITTPPPGNNTIPPATGGTEPNNRVMLRSQTDSMDSKRNTLPRRPTTTDSIGTNRTRMNNGNPAPYPVPADSIK